MSKVRSITPKDPADFTPELGNYKTLQPFRYWCQKVLPLVYDDSLSYYELLCKVVDYLNKTMEDVETLHGDVTNLHVAYEELQSYVNDYFSTLDVQDEINNKLDQMVENGTLADIINEQVFSKLYNWYNIKAEHREGASYADEINNAIESNSKIIYIPAGEYEIEKPIIIIRNAHLIMDRNTVLKATTAMDYMVVVNPDSVENIAPDMDNTAQGSLFLNPIIEYGVLDCNNYASSGLAVNTYYHPHIHDIVIKNFNFTGLMCRYPDTGRGGGGTFDNITVNGNSAEYGFRITSNDTTLTNCASINCKVGYDMRGGHQSYITCTAWIGYDGVNIYKDSIGFLAHENNSFNTLIDCSFDTVHTGLYLTKNSIVNILHGFGVFNTDVINPSELGEPTWIVTDESSVAGDYTSVHIFGFTDYLTSPHNFCRRSDGSKMCLANSSIYGVKPLGDINTIYLDKLELFNPKIFDNENISSAFFRTSNNSIIIVQIIGDIEMAGNDVIVGSVNIPVLSYATEYLPAVLLDETGISKDIKLQRINRTLQIVNTGSSTHTLKGGNFFMVFPNIDRVV